MKKEMLLSFVIPCYGSEKTIELVVDEIISKVSERPGYDYEIIATNDCSPDNVWDVLLKLAAENKKIKLINFAKNMNRPGAVMAGLSVSSGDFAVIMDDDGQCPMDRLWDLLKPLDEGYDVSIAKYPSRKQSAFKDFGTNVNKKMTRFMLDRPKDMEFTNFMACKRFVVKEILRYKNPYPYMTGLILRTTQKICNVPMDERERYNGGTNFTLKKLISLWVNGLTAFSIKPLRIASATGALFSVAGFIYLIYIVISKLVNPSISSGYSSIMAIILFIGGLLMLMIGLIGEYVGRIYISINNSPQYVIKEKVNCDEYE